MIKPLIFNSLKLLFIFKKRKLDFKPEKILLIRSAAIGDVIMTTPLIRTLKENFRAASIDYLVGNWSKRVFDNNPNINKVISFDDSVVVDKKIGGLKRIITRLKKEKYDLCIVLDKHFVWNLIAFLIKPKFRLGFDRAGEGFPNNLSVPYNASKYELEYYLDVARKLGLSIKTRKPEVFASKKDISSIDRLIARNKNFLVIAPAGAKNPGQELAAKRYPKEKYTDIIDKLAEKRKIILIGGKEDKKITSWVFNKCENKRNILDTTGKINIQQTAYLISKTKLLLTNDSGAMHIGSTTNTKIIAIFGPTAPKRFAPKGAMVIRSKKHKPCYDMYGRSKKPIPDYYEDVTPEQILKIINNLI